MAVVATGDLRLTRCPSQNSKLRQVIDERDAEYRACKEQQRIQPLGMLADPIALACCDFQCTIDVVTRVIRSVNPFCDPKFGIEKENNIRVRKLCSRPAILKSDRFKKRVNVLPTSSADKPAERNLFARAISGQLLRRVGGIEREQQHSKLSRIRRRASERGLELINIRDARAWAASIDRQEDNRKTAEFRQASDSAAVVNPIDRRY